MNNKTKRCLLAAFRDGAPYRWVWYFQSANGQRTTICSRNVGYHEAKELAEKDNKIGVGYQYVPDQRAPKKVSLVFPKAWDINYTVRRDKNGVVKLFRKGTPSMEFIEDLTGQFPKCFTTIYFADVKIGCIR